jgi:hypothetical protein
MIGTVKIEMRIMKNTQVTLWIMRKIKMAMAKIRMRKFTWLKAMRADSMVSW